MKKHSSREVGYGVGTLRVETELDKVSMEKEQRNRFVLVEKFYIFVFLLLDEMKNRRESFSATKSLIPKNILFYFSFSLV